LGGLLKRFLNAFKMHRKAIGWEPERHLTTLSCYSKTIPRSENGALHRRTSEVYMSALRSRSCWEKSCGRGKNRTKELKSECPGEDWCFLEPGAKQAEHGLNAILSLGIN